MQLPLIGDLGKLSTRWKSLLDPVLANILLNGRAIEGVALINGNTVINHKLSRVQQGWLVTDIDAVASIYRSATFNDKTLTLHSSAACNVNLWVF